MRDTSAPTLPISNVPMAHLVALPIDAWDSGPTLPAARSVDVLAPTEMPPVAPMDLMDVLTEMVRVAVQDAQASAIDVCRALCQLGRK